MMRTSNPTLRQSIFEREQAFGAEPMTIQGTVNKCFILFFLLLISASWIWQKVMPAQTQAVSDWGMAAQPVVSSIAQNVGPYLWGGAILGMILAFVTIFNPRAAHITAPG